MHFRRSWGTLENSWESLGGPRGGLGRILGVSGTLFGGIGGLGGHSGVFLDDLGGILCFF